MTDAERIQWYQDQHELHYGLELLYVVDGYVLSCVMENGLVVWKVQAPTLAECIDLAVPQAAVFRERYLAMKPTPSSERAVQPPKETP